MTERKTNNFYFSSHGNEIEMNFCFSTNFLFLFIRLIASSVHLRYYSKYLKKNIIDQNFVTNKKENFANQTKKKQQKKIKITFTLNGNVFLYQHFLHKTLLN